MAAHSVRHHTLAAPSYDGSSSDGEFRLQDNSFVRPAHSPTPRQPLHRPSLPVRAESPTFPSLLSSSSLLPRRRQPQLASPTSGPHSNSAASWANRPSRRPWLTTSLSLLSLLLLASSVAAVAAWLLLGRSPLSLAPSALVSLLPFLSPPAPPSLLIVSLVSSFPPPPPLQSSDPPRHGAWLVAHVALRSYLHLVPPARLVLLSASTNACHSLSSNGFLSEQARDAACHLIPAACVEGTQHRPLLPCVLSAVVEPLLTRLPGPAYVALVAPGVLLAPQLLATLATLTTSARSPFSPRSTALTVCSTEVTLPAAPAVMPAAQTRQRQQTEAAADSLHAALLADAFERSAAVDAIDRPPQPNTDLFVLPRAALQAIDLPHFVWGEVEADNEVWRKWLLHRLYTDRRMLVVDATHFPQPLAIRPLTADASSAVELATTARAVPALAYNQRVADERAVRGDMQLVVEVSGEAETGVGDDAELFLCWAQRLRLDGWLMAVRSAVTAERLRRRGVPVLAYPQRRLIHHVNQAAGAAEDARYRLWLNGLVSSMLRHNVSVMLTSAAIIPLSAEPFSHTRLGVNQHLLTTASTASSLSSSTSSPLPLPGLLVLSATAATLSHLSDERACLLDARNESALSARWVSCLRVPDDSVALSSEQYVSLDEYTSRRLSMRGHVPILLHTAASDKRHKANILQQWGLALSLAAQCTEPPLDGVHNRGRTVQSRGGRPGGSRVVLQVRVLTFDRAGALWRCLLSLSQVDWRWGAHPTAAAAVSTLQIRFVISIDAPAMPSSSIPSHPSTASVADSFCFDLETRWPSLSPFAMSCAVVVQRAHLGLVGQWTEIPPPAEDEVLAVLEDDVLVSSVWFRVVMDQLTRTYFHSHDPRLVSLALQHPLTVVGENSEQPYGSVQPHLVAAADCASARPGNASVAERRCYFLYQLFGTWGAVFLPGQYAAFSRWLHASPRNFSHIAGEGRAAPCVPSLLSNTWWQRRHNAVWSGWIIRWMYEGGRYSLYSAATDTARNDSAVVNMREVGENFKKAKGASNTPLLHWTAAETEQLHTRVRLPGERRAHSEDEAEADGVPVLAVYDFHFRRVPSADIDSLSHRAAILPASQFEQCWTRADWKAHRNATPTVATH